MRIHLTVRGKKTTVSIDDLLWDYLGAWAVDNDPSAHAKAKLQHELALTHIKHYVKVSEHELPDKNLSQHLQSVIIRLIAAPNLAAIISARGARYDRQKDRQEGYQRWKDRLQQGEQ